MNERTLAQSRTGILPPLEISGTSPWLTQIKLAALREADIDFKSCDALN
jgi:hypothetical protein